MKIARWIIYILILIFFTTIHALPATATDKTSSLLEKVWGCDDTGRVLELTSPPLRGHDVRELEQRLQQLEFDPGSIDGVFDLETKTAVELFQRSKKLEANGVVTMSTWDALGEDCEPAAKQKTPPPPGRVKIVINRSARQLTVYSDGEPYKVYPVAIGEPDTPSPVGEWKIINKSVRWGSGFGTRWMGLNVPWGIYGIHGTNKPWSIGRAASHGCFRMFNQNVEEIFPWIEVGTPVIVEDNVTRLSQRHLKAGITGQDVVVVQLKLRQEKLLWTPADGRFGPATERALRLFQLLNGLPDTGEVDQETWKLILNQEGSHEKLRGTA